MTTKGTKVKVSAATVASTFGFSHTHKTVVNDLLVWMSGHFTHLYLFTLDSSGAAHLALCLLPPAVKTSRVLASCPTLYNVGPFY